MQLIKPFAAGVVVLASVSAAGAADIRAIYSTVAGHPTNSVPTTGGIFNPGSGSQFDRPFRSADGKRFMFSAIQDGVPDLDVVVVGTLSPFSAATVIKESDAYPPAAGVLFSSISTTMGVNDAGAWAIAGDTDAATTADAVVLKFDGVNFTEIAREGSPSPAAGLGWGSTNDATRILNDGRVAGRSSSLVGSTTQQILHIGGVLFAQTDVTIPTGQLVAPDQSIDNFTADRFAISADGSTTLYGADLNGPTATDLVMVRNGAVVAQEGAPLPGSGFVSNVLAFTGDAGSPQMSPSGAHWLFRGSNADAIDWVVRNGVVVAVTDAPITPGNAELFDDATFANCFFLNTTNNRGDYIVGGVTNATDVNANAVLVLNGEVVAIREGDPVDLDGNGMFDDDAFVSVFNNDDSFLAENLRYYFFADLRNSAGTSIGQAFLIADLSDVGCLADFNRDGSVSVQDIFDFLSAYFSNLSGADFSGGGGITVQDIFDFLAAYFAGC